jgi:hypothetical protein
MRITLLEKFLDDGLILQLSLQKPITRLEMLLE